jgi:hypothetical protein
VSGRDHGAGWRKVLLFSAITVIAAGVTGPVVAPATVALGVARSGAAQTPASFLRGLGSAVRSGNTSYLLARLNGAVIRRFGTAECRSYLAASKDPTASYTVLSVGRAGPFVYVMKGKRVVVENVVPVRVRAVRHGATVRTTVHLAESGHPATYSWFANCGQKVPVTSTAGVSRFAASYKGRWTIRTFGSGPVTISLVIKGSAPGSSATMDLTLSGGVLGGKSPPPEVFTGRVGSSGLSLWGASVLGHLTWHVASGGAVTVSGTGAPGGEVSAFTASGSFTATGVSLKFWFSLADELTATGQIRATKT